MLASFRLKANVKKLGHVFEFWPSLAQQSASARDIINYIETGKRELILPLSPINIAKDERVGLVIVRQRTYDSARNGRRLIYKRPSGLKFFLSLFASYSIIHVFIGLSLRQDQSKPSPSTVTPELSYIV